VTRYDSPDPATHPKTGSRSPTGSRAFLIFLTIITASTTLDVIQGVGLDQEFEIVTPAEEGNAGYGFLHTLFRRGVRSLSFAIERLRVSKKTVVCRR
jgi:hypothetical protein